MSEKTMTEIRQHVGWLKQYVHGASQDNWRDMMLRAERQLEDLSAALDRDHAQEALGCGTPGCTDPHCTYGYEPAPPAPAGEPEYPSVEAMKAAVELEILSCLGRVHTVKIGQLIQKIIDAAPQRSGQMTAKEAIEIGMKIAEEHDTCLRSMAKEFYSEIPQEDLRKLIHGNKVWLAAQIMKAMQAAEARSQSPGGGGHD